ncbi:MAG: fibronectin type III domain-containing protein [Thermoguttaceae bacterium]
MLRSIRNELFGATKNRTRRSTNRSSRELRFEGLEAREMMAVGVVPAPALLAAANQHNGTGLASVSSAVTTKGVRAPAAPSFTAAAVSGSEVDLSWSTVSGATGYVIDELSSPGKWSQIGKVGSSATEYAVTGLSSGATYTFRVGASNSAGTSWANSQSVTTLQVNQPPAAPTAISPASGATGVSLTPTLTASAYSAPDGEPQTASLFAVYAAGSNTQEIWSGTGSSGNLTTATIPAGVLTPGTTYHWYVWYADQKGWSSQSNSPTFTTSTSSSLTAPTFTATAASGTQVNVAWSPVSGASGYVVEYLANGLWWSTGFGSGVTSDSVTGLNPGTSYAFKVGAENSAGITWANSQSVTTISTPSVVVNHPTAATAYTPVSGSLFGPGGPSYLDVQQGAASDCWLMASLAEVAARDPQAIENMFTSEGTAMENGTLVNLYRVRFFNNSGVAEYVTVDNELPSGGTYYDHIPANGALWAALAEKAYAQANAAGYVSTLDEGDDSYNALNGAYPSYALRAITGEPASDLSINPANVTSAWYDGQFIVLGSNLKPANSDIVGNHCYAVVYYSALSNTPFELYNPWGNSASAQENVYGTFSANAAFLSAYFNSDSIGTAAAVGMNALSNGPQEVANILDTSATVRTANMHTRDQTDGLSAGRASRIVEQNPIVPLNSLAHDRVLQSSVFDRSSDNLDWLDDSFHEFGGGHPNSKKHGPFQPALDEAMVMTA